MKKNRRFALSELLGILIVVLLLLFILTNVKPLIKKSGDHIDLETKMKVK